ncbi:MAG: hypothetical protein GC168_12440 [Candidatus Hydrogenedens sp.]|nr:hypothetical protein [Candidatus Hydrogenedens sp.]
MRSRLYTFGAWVFSLVVVPLLLLAGLEAGLRLAGVGVDGRIIVPRTFEGQRYYALNGDFFRLFLGTDIPPNDRIQTPQFVAADKPADAFRVFVFGGSAAKGWPNSAFSFWRCLEAMCEKAYPGTRFEFYCYAYEGMDTTVMREVAEAVASHLHPDLFLVYAGNNEFAGPFSFRLTEGVTPAEREAQFARVVPLLQSRIFQAIARYRQSLFPGNAAPWVQGGYLDTPQAKLLLACYRDNLSAIATAARQAGAGVVLSTLAVNERDWPNECDTPIGNFSPEVVGGWQATVNDALEHYRAQDYTGALERLADAEATANGPSLEFLRGRCLLAQGDDGGAAKAFRLARDWSPPGYARARTPTNAIVREVADGMHEPAVAFVDGEAYVAAKSPHGIPGADFFTDHCHLSPEAAYHLACAYWQAVSAQVAERRGQARVEAVPLTYAECAEWLAFDDYQHLEWRGILLNANRGRLWMELEGLEAEYARLAEIIRPATPEERYSILTRAIELGGNDYLVGLEYLGVTAQLGRNEIFRPLAKTMAGAYPFDAVFRQYYSTALLQAGDSEAGLAQLGNALVLNPSDLDLRLSHADTLSGLGRCGEALESVKTAFRLAPDNARTWFCRARARICGQHPAALEDILTGIELQPDSPEGYQTLEQYYRDVKQAERSLASTLEEITALHPESVPAAEALARARVSK